jgi:hypothetical protein
VRIEYTLPGGFKLYTLYANSGNTFDVNTFDVPQERGFPPGWANTGRIGVEYG